MHRSRAVVIACALLLGACGESSGPSSSAAPPKQEVSDRSALVDEANQLCEQAGPELRRTSAQIQAATTDAETRAAWTEQHGVVVDLFTQLRGVAKVGVDKPYDTALAKLGTVLGIVQRVPDDVGDEEELSATFQAMQVYVNDFGEAARAAELDTCVETFSDNGEDEQS